jgi:uncharacterized protein YdiU (UPF0061 family)
MAQPLAMAHAGHQFGHFSPQRGRRAILLGEIIAACAPRSASQRRWPHLLTRW